VDSREARVAKNEAMHRAVNREIEHAAEDFGERGGDTIEVLCECGQPGCKSLLSLTIGDYDRLHGQRDLVLRRHANDKRVVAAGVFPLLDTGPCDDRVGRGDRNDRDPNELHVALSSSAAVSGATGLM